MLKCIVDLIIKYKYNIFGRRKTDDIPYNVFSNSAS